MHLYKVIQMSAHVIWRKWVHMLFDVVTYCSNTGLSMQILHRIISHKNKYKYHLYYLSLLIRQPLSHKQPPSNNGEKNCWLTPLSVLKFRTQVHLAVRLDSLSVWVEYLNTCLIRKELIGNLHHLQQMRTKIANVRSTCAGSPHSSEESTVQ